jgi:hypothetical protein
MARKTIFTAADARTRGETRAIAQVKTGVRVLCRTPIFGFASVLLGTVLFGMMFCGFFSMMNRVEGMPVCSVGMMRCLFVAAALIVLGCFVVMAGRMFMMLRRLGMMFCALFTHKWREFGICVEGVTVFDQQAFLSHLSH